MRPSSPGHRHRLPYRVAFPGYRRWEHPGFVVVQDQQGPEDREQLLPAELGIRRLDHRNVVHEPVHHLHHHGPVGSGAGSVRPVASNRLCSQ